MSSSSAILTLDQWQIRFHEAMAALLRAQEAVKQQIGLLSPLNGLWKCSRDLKALNATLKAVSELPDAHSVKISSNPKFRSLASY
jgi:hypothetical protein